MLKGHGSAGLEYFPVLGNTLSDRDLVEVIISGRAKPLPPLLSQVMDDMFWWGKQMSQRWYDIVVELLSEALDIHVAIERTELVSMFISSLVMAEIHEHFAVDSVAEHLLLLEWMKWFIRTYKKGDCTQFKIMAMKSLEVIEHAISLVKREE
jgi:hypothetical protein